MQIPNEHLSGQQKHQSDSANGGMKKSSLHQQPHSRPQCKDYLSLGEEMKDDHLEVLQ